MKFYDPSAIGSDIPRSFKQYIARKFASCLINILGLNKPWILSTEIVQQISPVCTIPTKHGDIRCRGGHGRLCWRASTFYTEEPETVKWLESLGKEDYLWDIGANVGLYSIYAAKHTRCTVLAVEPEAQNFAILIENIVMNNMQEYIESTNLAITSNFGIGKLHVHAITKGGAYNQFFLNSAQTEIPNNVFESEPVAQIQIGISLDDLVDNFNYQCPSHIKIDVEYIGKRVRKYYSLTEVGRSWSQQKVDEFFDFVNTLTYVLNPIPA